MNIDETRKILASIKVAYPEFNRDFDEEEHKAAVRLWHKILEPFSYEDCNRTLVKHIKNCKFAPKICEIYQPAQKLHESRPTREGIERMRRVIARMDAESEQAEIADGQTEVKVMLPTLAAAKPRGYG